MERLLELKMLPLSYLREVYDITLFYDMLHNRLNIDMNRYFLTNIQVRRGRSNNENVAIVPRLYRTESRRSFYTNHVLKIWYNLPKDIRNIIPPVDVSRKPRQFKNSLNRFYFNRLTLIYDINNVCTWTHVCNCINCRI